MAALAAFFIVKAPLRRMFVIFLFGAILTPALVVLWLGAESDTSGFIYNTVQMGRQDDAQDAATLTGRIPIWRQVIVDVSDRPLFGYGYGDFWTAQRVWEYSHILEWQFNHAHSAYLETMLNNGAVGLALGLLIVISVQLTTIRNFWQTGDIGFRFVFAVLALALIHGLSDSNFVVVGFAPLLVLMCIFLIVLHHEPQQEQPYGSVG